MDTPPSSPLKHAFVCGDEGESFPWSATVMKPTVPDSQKYGDRRDNDWIGVEGHDPSKSIFPDASDPANRETTFANVQSRVFVEDSEEAVPLLVSRIGEGGGGDRRDGIRNRFASPERFSSTVSQAETRGEFSCSKGFCSAGAVVFDRDGGISRRGGDSRTGVEGLKKSNGFVKNVVQGVNDSSMSSMTEESAESSSAELMRRQMESLLARVEFLERRQQGLDTNTAARAAAAAAAAAVAAASYTAQATAPRFPEGGDGVRGWGSSSGSRRRRSEFVSREAGDFCRGQGATMFTPPPRRARGDAEGREGNGDASTMMGVSTTPFTGLDVLFRTPNVRFCLYANKMM